VHGRPVAWVFTGTPPQPDGSEIFLDDALAAASVNHAQLVAGAAYPLFYDTLYASLRLILTAAAVGAEQRKDGLWASDATLTGVDGSTVGAGTGRCDRAEAVSAAGGVPRRHRP
jgi:hypothetical protein